MTTVNRDHFEEFVEETFDIPAVKLESLRTVDNEGTEGYVGMPSDDADVMISCMWMTWKASKADNWKADKGFEYDKSIHSNPDALAWARFFLETFPRCGVDEDTMMGWFANAMMARHDFDKQQEESGENR